MVTHVKAVEDKIRTTEGLNCQRPNPSKKARPPSHLQPVIDQLVNERLLRTEGDGDEATVSISHKNWLRRGRH
jgi:hypothetical protein